MVLEANNIHKSYGSLHILQGIDLAIEEGEVVSIIGKSGAGKSTLLHILGTLDSADKGTLRIRGKSVLDMSPALLSKFRNASIGFVFQFHHLLPEFTALENVCMPGFIAGRAEEEVRYKAKELLDYLGLKDRLDHKPTELSGGEQQRAAFARALINNPSIIFADEPTGNLDSGSSEDMHNLILQLRKDYGQTFVIVTHNSDLAHLSDRRLEIQGGLLNTK